MVVIHGCETLCGVVCEEKGGVPSTSFLVPPRTNIPPHPHKTTDNLMPIIPLGPPCRVWHFDCTAPPTTSSVKPINMHVVRSGVCHAVRYWWVLDLGGGVVLSTAPADVVAPGVDHALTSIDCETPFGMTSDQWAPQQVTLQEEEVEQQQGKEEQQGKDQQQGKGQQLQYHNAPNPQLQWLPQSVSVCVGTMLRMVAHHNCIDMGFHIEVGGVGVC